MMQSIIFSFNYQKKLLFFVFLREFLLIFFVQVQSKDKYHFKNELPCTSM